MKAAVDAAHALGKRIAIHSYGPAGARDAGNAGIDSLEHDTDMDDATIAELVRRKVWYVHTIDHNRYYADNAKMLQYPAGAVAGLNGFIEAGMTPEQALKTATVNGAELLGQEKHMGALKPGCFADLVAAEDDPTANINAAIQKVSWLVKGGEIVVHKTKM